MRSVLLHRCPHCGRHFDSPSWCVEGDCATEPVMENAPGKPIPACSYCGQSGHTSRACPQLLDRHLASGLSWIDRYVVRPHAIHLLMRTDEYTTPANPWYRKWAERGLVRNSWPWRIRIEFQWNSRKRSGRSIAVGLLFFDCERTLKAAEFGFGVYVYDAGNGWIESVAT